jgi:hypothetical protein
MLTLDVSKGKWKLQASYTAARKTGGGQKLWTGTLPSAPVKIEITDPPKRR